MRMIWWWCDDVSPVLWPGARSEEAGTHKANTAGNQWHEETVNDTGKTHLDDTSRLSTYHRTSVNLLTYRLIFHAMLTRRLIYETSYEFSWDLRIFVRSKRVTISQGFRRNFVG